MLKGGGRATDVTEEPEGVGVADLLFPMLVVPKDGAPILYDCEIAIREKKELAAANMFDFTSA